MSGYANPRKDHRFILELDGANQFLIQEIVPPEAEYETHEHGAPGNIPNPETPGKIKFTDLVVKKLMPADTADRWAWDWFSNGLLGDNLSFRKQGFLVDLGGDANSAIQTWYLGNIWPKKIVDQARMSDGSGGNLIQEVTFSVQMYFPKESPVIATLLTGAAGGAGGAAFLAGNDGI